MASNIAKPPERFGIRFERWFHDHWAAVANYAGTISLALAGVAGFLIDEQPSEASEAFIPWWPWSAAATTVVLLISGAALVGAGLVGGIIAAKNTSDLQDDFDAVSRDLRTHASAVETVLRAIMVRVCTDLGLYRDDTRASIYALDGDEFVLLARVSKNPTLKVGGRPSYPADQGIIGLAWKHGQYSITGLAENRAEWEREAVAEHGIPPEVAAKLRMQCRSIVGIRVDGVEPELHPLAIVIFESEAPRGVNGKTIDQVLGTPAWETLAAAVKNMQGEINGVAGVRRDLRAPSLSEPPKRTRIQP